MRKAIPALFLWFALFGLALAACLAAWQWRLVWVENHPSIAGSITLDWEPYPGLLNMALNWWVPFSILICGAFLFLNNQSLRRFLLVLGWCSHAVSTISLVVLGRWVFTVPLPGASGVWWM